VSEGRNPLDVKAQDGYVGRFDHKVAFDGLMVRSRQELEGHDPDAQDLVTLILAKGHEHDGSKHIHLDRLAHSAVDMLTEREPGFPKVTRTVEEWLKDRASTLFEHCQPDDPDIICTNMATLYINGFSGPGYAPLCWEHATEPIDRLDPQVWLPVWVSLTELDELVYHGALRPDWG